MFGRESQPDIFGHQLPWRACDIAQGRPQEIRLGDGKLVEASGTHEDEKKLLKGILGSWHHEVNEDLSKASRNSGSLRNSC